MAIRYIPNPLPVIGARGKDPYDEIEEMKVLIRFLYEEILSISRVINQSLEILREVQAVEPAKRQVGMVKFFDGTTFNPGAGRGLYIYNADRWEKL